MESLKDFFQAKGAKCGIKKTILALEKAFLNRVP